MTSNIASDLILAYKGKDYDRMKDEALNLLRTSFRPEFHNPVDEIVVFHPLSRDELRQIVAIQMRGLRKRLEERKIELELTDKATDYLAERGYDPQYGARPLKRLVQHDLETGLARKILAGDVRDGSRVVVDAGPRGLAFEVKAPAAKAAAA
jgi:ATP-dependent Clp protease ATP-binding subunit ClpB